MSAYIYEKKQVGRYTVKVVQDENPMNPRKEFDNLCTMVCFHRRYDLGDKHNYTPETIQEYLAINKKTVFWKPLYLYDHSGITISTGPFSCPWDSGQVGYIFIEREQFLKEFGFKIMNKKAKEALNNLLDCETEIYDNYLTGAVYGWMVEDEEGYALDSRWGYYGDPKYALEEGIQAANWIINTNIKKHIKQVKTWIQNRVPLEYRSSLTI